MKMERKLTSKGNDKFELEMYDKENEYLQVKGYTRDELRDAYKSIKLQYDQLIMASKDNKKKIDNIDVEDTEELRKMLDVMEKASKLSEKKKLEEQLAAQTKEMANFIDQMKEISVAVPEVLRNK